MNKVISLIGLVNTYDLEQISDLGKHNVLNEYLEREEPLYNWFEIENSLRKSANGGSIHFLNVTS